MKNLQTGLSAILPQRWRSSLDEKTLSEAQEIRLHLGMPPVIVTRSGSEILNGTVEEADLSCCLNLASRYSPWNAASMSSGFLTAPGGHRIGICGESTPGGFRSITSLCIRISRDLPGISDRIIPKEDLLILGPPGSGKTTLLRDLVRRISRERQTVSVVDERCELFPLDGKGFRFDPGPNTDVLLGRKKREGIDMVLRSMGPQWIAVDEITAEENCLALSQAAWCGVRLLATAHAGSVKEFLSRCVYAPLVRTGIFRTAVVLKPDKSYHEERITL